MKVPVRGRAAVPVSSRNPTTPAHPAALRRDGVPSWLATSPVLAAVRNRYQAGIGTGATWSSFSSRVTDPISVKIARASSAASPEPGTVPPRSEIRSR